MLMFLWNVRNNDRSILTLGTCMRDKRLFYNLLEKHSIVRLVAAAINLSGGGFFGYIPLSTKAPFFGRPLLVCAVSLFM